MSVRPEDLPAGPDGGWPETEDRPANPFEAAWPFDVKSPLIEGLISDRRFLSVMLVDVTGLDWPAISGHLQTVRDIAAAKRMVPVVVVDLTDFRGLVEEGLAYDTLPNIAANAPLAPDLDWPSYVARRRQLLREKWRPAAIVNLGAGPEWDVP